MAELEPYSKRSMYRAVLRQLRWLGSWAKQLVGPDSPEVKALAAAYVATAAGAKQRGIDLGDIKRWEDSA